MSEKSKMLNGELYNPHDPLLVNERHECRILLHKINQLDEEHKKERQRLIRKLLKNKGKNLWIEPPFYCDYGYNIYTGSGVFMNFNCCIIDVMKVSIGDQVLIGPNVQIYTANHPIDVKTRNRWLEYAQPVTIGNNVWVGGAAVICPGVTIGEGAVIAAGAVVSKSIPCNVVVAGNPAKIIKTIHQ